MTCIAHLNKGQSMTCGVKEHSDLNLKEESQGKYLTGSQKYDLLVLLQVSLYYKEESQGKNLKRSQK